MVLDRVHRVACATDMVQSQSWEPVPVEAAVKTGKCGWYIVQVLLSATPAENPQDKVRNTSLNYKGEPISERGIRKLQTPDTVWRVLI